MPVDRQPEIETAPSDELGSIVVKLEAQAHSEQAAIVVFSQREWLLMAQGMRTLMAKAWREGR